MTRQPARGAARGRRLYGYVDHFNDFPKTGAFVLFNGKHRNSLMGPYLVLPWDKHAREALAERLAPIILGKRVCELLPEGSLKLARAAVAEIGK